MEAFLNRYRSISVLLLVILGQLLLIAYRVKNKQDVPLIRVWAVTAVSPAARVLEGLRGGSSGFLHSYIVLHDADTENRRLREENGQLKLENIFLKNELNRADRAKALQLFQARTASKAVAASIIMMGAGSSSREVFVDRGSTSGIMRGMAVVTPDGIVGIVRAAYPTASEVLLITDADFAAGVVTQKTQVRGTLKGDGTPTCRVDYVPAEDKVEAGDWFYTSGEDRVFPSGFPVGVIKSVRPAQPFQEILVEPVGLKAGQEDVLILTEGVHQEIPDTPVTNQPIYIAPPPPNSNTTVTDLPTGATGTEADRLRALYKSVGDAQNHTFGQGEPGSKPPDFSKLPVKPGTGAAATSPQPLTPNSQPPVSNPQPPPQPPTVRRSNQAAGAPGGPPKE
ncbi:MAG TPA: rod shape-determining protein MreC [Bryobacteraceae bacterium]|nr:rod shape-determining protein MreC [Bryobacteraceae bacterium]